MQLSSPVDLKVDGRPLGISTLKAFGAVTFAGSTDKVFHLFNPGNFIASPWNGCFIGRKTEATQAQDFAMLFRLITFEGSRFTLSVLTGGALNLRLRSSDGVIQREVLTTANPSINEDFYAYYSWDPSTGTLSFKVISDISDYGSYTSSTQTSLVAFTGETSGIYFGNSESGLYPYKGKIYGGSFSFGSAYNISSLEILATSKILIPGKDFLVQPKYFGSIGTSTIRETHNKNLSVSVSSLPDFWA